MNVFAKFDEISSMTLRDIKVRKPYGHTFVRLFVRSDNVKTVTLPQTQFAGGIKKRKNMYTPVNPSFTI